MGRTKAKPKRIDTDLIGQDELVRSNLDESTLSRKRPIQPSGLELELTDSDNESSERHHRRITKMQKTAKPIDSAEEEKKEDEDAKDNVQPSNETETLLATEPTTRKPEIEVLKCHRKRMKTILKMHALVHSSREDGGFHHVLSSFRLNMTSLEHAEVGTQYSILTCNGVSTLFTLFARQSKEKIDTDPICLAMQSNLIEVTVTPLELDESSAVDIQISLTEYAFIACSPNEIGVNIPLKRPHFQKKVLNGKDFAIILQDIFSALFHHTILSQFLIDSPKNKRAGKSKVAEEAIITAQMIYNAVDNDHASCFDGSDIEDENTDSQFSVTGLVPTLRKYQEAAVKWMVQRERGDCTYNGWEVCWFVFECNPRVSIVPLYEWKKQCTDIGVDIPFYNPFTGWIVKGYQKARECTVGKENILKGGILAESMGLGKTVEVLACILKNPSPSHQSDKDFTDFDSENEVQENSDFTNGESCICYCGKGSKCASTLSWVFCSQCKEPMHGICAGFHTEEELIARTRTGQLDSKSQSYRICHESRCPSCVAEKHGTGSNNLIQSKATLIITPPSILSQWEREIKRHTRIQDTEGNFRSLRVLIYTGVKEICNMSHKQAKESGQRKLVHSRYLSNADIVLTTFQTLMSELTHSDDNPYVPSGEMTSKRYSRREKRYRIVPSPLLNIQWWRVALDEAQRVETPTAASARMALKLAAHHRWAVSGTPVGRGKVDDLYGLMLFLRTTPFDHKNSFKVALKSNHPDVNGRIRHLLHDILWRSTKANSAVRDQMGIPEMTEKKFILKFSSVEKHFYMRQLEETLLAAQPIFQSAAKKRKEKDIEVLAHHLRRLRAACCHPQVGSSGIRVKKGQQHKSSGMGTSIATGVLSMSQILDHLIEDAKLKAEEAQRVFVLHSNSIAALHRLRSQSDLRGAIIDLDDEVSLLKKSISVYQRTLDVAKSNSCPSAAVGEAILSGSNGFNSQSDSVRDGSADLIWKLWLADDSDTFPNPWVKFEFSQKKKINFIAVRPIVSNTEFSRDSSAIIMYPKECVLQVSNPVCGGMFVDSLSFQIPHPNEENDNMLEWRQFEDFGPEKSKIWKIVVKSFHDDTNIASKKSFGNALRIFTGLQVQLMEPDIELDILQRLHILHNASITLTELSGKLDDGNCDEDRGQYTRDYIKDTISQMDQERLSLEHHQTEAKQVLQRSAQVRLDEVTKKRLELINDLSSGEGVAAHVAANEVVPWYKELLSCMAICSDQRLQTALASYTEDALFELFNTPNVSFSNRRTFPITNSFSGFQMALQMRLETNPFYSEMDDLDHNEVFVCIKAISNLGDTPSEAELTENSLCHKCRADWNQTGPKCRYCKLEEKLSEYEVKVKDEETICVLQSLSDWVKRNINPLQRAVGPYIDVDRLVKRIDKFFEFHSIVVKEISFARSKWRTHLDLLSRLDELNSCKTTRRLAYEGENWNLDQGLVIHPRDIPALLMDDSAKQAMAEGTLRKSKELLRFLKNQNVEQKLLSNDSSENDLRNICSICLESFTSERAVLRCGHMYHYKPCLERLFARGGHNTIVCPMRCAIRTKRDDILIATDIRKDDGSKLQQKIEGSWGTKVDRLVSDLISVVQRGEKSIVFSQWLDMLDIVEAALQINSIEYIRPKSIKKFGKCLDSFRTTSCHVLLMDIKHGAEGLTVVEATHVFMIEPLLNHSMDSQAINRIHRIGQTSKTFVHRYIIQDTVEIKIDKLRSERQIQEYTEDEEPSSQKKQKCLSAGGVDGGFDEFELKDLLNG